jgi:hypothetical protein
MTTFQRFSTYPERMQKLIILRMTWTMAVCLSENAANSSGEEESNVPLANKDLYLPKWRPEGEVVVDSRHFLIFPRKDSSVSVGVMMLGCDCLSWRKIVAQSSGTLAGGVYVPFNMSVTVDESAVQGIELSSGD